MKLLVLGGTVFLGRALVEAALAAGHEVTTFTRGKSNPDLFPEAERLRGDREQDLSALAGREWDAVVDTSGYEPEVVRASAELLAGTHYTFISSISAYADFSKPVHEDSPLADDDEYGGKKARCERELRDPALVIRPGLIVGAWDPTGRFTYWPHRIARGGDVLVPGTPETRVQFIDVRDLADWTLRMAQRRATGVFNATGNWTMGELVETCREVSGSDAHFVWVDDEFLVEREVGPWMELPLWIPGGDYAGMMQADTSRAVDAGLTFRPLAETVRESLEHAATTDDAGLAPDRERELLRLLT